MKEYNLTFLEAVEALKEEKCLGIEGETGCQYEIEGSIVSHSEKRSMGIKLSPRSFLGKWRLVDPKPVKRKEITEEIIWQGGNGKTIYPVGRLGHKWSDLIGKPPMKMTLEWEE